MIVELGGLAQMRGPVCVFVLGWCDVLGKCIFVTIFKANETPKRVFRSHFLLI